MENFNMQELLSLDKIAGSAEGEEMVVYEKLELIHVESNPKDRQEDLESDYSKAREIAHIQTQMLMDMAEIALHNAKNSDSPRHVEVFTGLMSQLSASNMALIKIHKEMKDITDEKTTTGDDNKNGGGSGSNMNIENATVFVGSPTELMQQRGSAYDTKPVIDSTAEEVTDVERTDSE